MMVMICIHIPVVNCFVTKSTISNSLSMRDLGSSNEIRKYVLSYAFITNSALACDRFNAGQSSSPSQLFANCECIFTSLPLHSLDSMQLLRNTQVRGKKEREAILALLTYTLYKRLC